MKTRDYTKCENKRIIGATTKHSENRVATKIWGRNNRWVAHKTTATIYGSDVSSVLSSFHSELNECANRMKTPDVNSQFTW